MITLYDYILSVNCYKVRLLMSLLELDYTSVLRIARSVREQIDWPSLRQRTRGSPYALAFFVMCEELGIVPSDAQGMRGAEVRVLTPRTGR